MRILHLKRGTIGFGNLFSSYIQKDIGYLGVLRLVRYFYHNVECSCFIIL